MHEHQLQARSQPRAMGPPDRSLSDSNQSSGVSMPTLETVHGRQVYPRWSEDQGSTWRVQGNGLLSKEE